MCADGAIQGAVARVRVGAGARSAPQLPPCASHSAALTSQPEAKPLVEHGYQLLLLPATANDLRPKNTRPGNLIGQLDSENVIPIPYQWKHFLVPLVKSAI